MFSTIFVDYLTQIEKSKRLNTENTFETLLKKINHRVDQKQTEGNYFWAAITYTSHNIAKEIQTVRKI